MNEILQGRYRIVSQMGQNGTGPIYEAYDEALKADVVLREIPVKLNKVTTPAQMESMRSAFAEEAKILSGITHDSFIRVRDHFSEVDRHYLVMEAVDGEYLSELLEKKGHGFSVAEAAAWADQILEGLHYLHNQATPLVHSDIKPQNIKLAGDGKIKLLALGVAHNLQKGGSNITEHAFDATALHYLPLEQIWGNLDLASQKVISNSYDEISEELLMRPPDARSDIYAFGATLYHLLTGRRPIDALERSIDILEGKSDPLPTATKLDPNIPPEISYVMMKAMEIKREKRFESVLIMRQVLKTAAIRAKEREAQDTNKQPAIMAPEIRLPEPKQLKVGHQAADQNGDQNAAQKESEIEADPQQQLELIKARLLEAENKRQAAEQRAADAERRLHEKEISISKAPEDAPVLDIPDSSPNLSVLKEVEDIAPVLEVLEVLEVPEVQEKAVAEKPAAMQRLTASARPASNNFEFSSLNEHGTVRRSRLPMMAAAAVLLVAAGIGFGLWTFMSPGAKGSDGSIPAPAMSLSDQSKPPAAPGNVENTETLGSPSAPSAPSTAETLSQTNSDEAAQENSASQPASSGANPQTLKTKNAAQPKPAIAAKTPAKQKKALTVDDLINDN